jgi:hypothetical protein
MSWSPAAESNLWLHPCFKPCPVMGKLWAMMAEKMPRN